MTGPRQDNATLTEELLAAADELDAVTGESLAKFKPRVGTCDGCGEYKLLVSAYHAGNSEPWLCAGCAVENEGPRRQAALIRTVLADHAESSFGACATCQYAMSQWPCPTRIAVADCFLSSRSTVPGVTK